ncbi:hypothetical protein RP20_CCG000023 [Aedes albopictus]|nr:hypothetical protein RP20_CCG000023 [Aedes albopictus]
MIVMNRRFPEFSTRVFKHSQRTPTPTTLRHHRKAIIIDGMAVINRIFTETKTTLVHVRIDPMRGAVCFISYWSSDGMM